jgi:hypothetical protein
MAAASAKKAAHGNQSGKGFGLSGCGFDDLEAGRLNLTTLFISVLLGKLSRSKQ